jgi:hypothetical protein
MRKIQALLIAMVSIVLCMEVWAGGPAFNNFSADVVTMTQGKTHTAKVFIKDGKKRFELTSQGSKMIMITRPDKKVIWKIMPATKTYRVMPMYSRGKDMTSQLSDPNVKSEKKFIGNDTVDGHPAKKYHVTVIENGKKESSGFLWEATDMNNFPIKHQTEDGKRTTVCKNIKMGNVPDSLFELPAGYKNMTRPSMGGHKKMPGSK